MTKNISAQGQNTWWWCQSPSLFKLVVTVVYCHSYNAMPMSMLVC